MSEAALAAARTTRRAVLTEDQLAVFVGLLIFFLALPGVVGFDLLGWVASTSVWVDPAKALGAVSKAYAGFGGLAALAATFLALLGTLSLVTYANGGDVKKFALAFTVVFAVAYASWFLGSYAHLAAVTPTDFSKFGISWSLRLTNEGGFLVALIAGLVIANFFPRFAEWLHEAIRPEFYVKIAIVILGGFIAVTAAGKLTFASSLLLRGVAAIIEAYLIYWAVVYFVARKYFGFSREWAAPLASGISICGVSAAIATGGAIRARPQVAVFVSSLVVIFAVVEVALLPFVAQKFFAHEPLVAAAWLGLAVKTDGAAVAAGAITESLLLSEAAAEGVQYQAGWILGTTTTVKVFIDIFIGVWAFVLAEIWTKHVNAGGADKARLIEIWRRFPKFILGFVATFVIALALALGGGLTQKLTPVIAEANSFRVIFFILTFFSIGVLSNFRKLWEDGIGRLAALYFVSLFGFVIWVGLAISWLFFAGVKPPLAS